MKVASGPELVILATGLGVGVFDVTKFGPAVGLVVFALTVVVAGGWFVWKVRA
jgi:hypothetical protein